MSVKVQGSKELTKKLNKLVLASDKSKKAALEEIGQRAVRILKQNTPVDSGRLKQSMGYSTNGNLYSNPMSMSDSIEVNKEKDSVIAGTNVEYAENVEYNATNGSQGFFFRSRQQIAKIVSVIIAKNLKRGLKL